MKLEIYCIKMNAQELHDLLKGLHTFGGIRARNELPRNVGTKPQFYIVNSDPIEQSRKSLASYLPEQ